MLVLYQKTNASVIIERITELIKRKISEEIKKANIFTVQIDTTQDVNVFDQFSFVIKFINEF